MQAPTVVAPSEADALESDRALRLAMHLPLSFGQKPKAATAAAEDVTRAHADLLRRAADDSEGEDEDGRGQQGAGQPPTAENDPWHLPVTHEAVLHGHSRLTSCVDIEHTGTRLVTGGHDSRVLLYDFAGMKRDLQPFRSLEPCGAHHIRAVSWSPSGDAFLVVPASAEPKVIDRDGREMGYFVRGDMYIRDCRHTKGHIMACTSGQWHPHDRNTVLTASEDGTLRLWDITHVSSQGGAAGSKCQTAVIKPVSSKPGRVAVTACCWSPDGHIVAGAISDGSLQLWSATSNFASAAVGQVLPPKAQGVSQQTWRYSTRPLGVAKQAHQGGEDGSVTCLRFKRDGRTLAARSGDGTIKLWDVRNLGAGPLAQLSGLPAMCPQAGLVWSPDESLLLASVCASTEAKPVRHGAVVVCEAASLKPVRTLPVPGSGGPGGGVAGLVWHPRLNQIFVAAGSAAGDTCGVRVWYDPDFSERGILSAVARAVKPRDAAEAVLAETLVPQVYEPPSRVGGGRKRQREEQEKRDRERHVPQQPSGTYGAGGRVGGGTGGTLLTQHLLRQSGKLFDPDNEGDIRERLLAHPSEPKFVDQAYAETQPKKIYADVEAEQKDGEQEEYQ